MVSPAETNQSPNTIELLSASGMRVEVNLAGAFVDAWQGPEGQDLLFPRQDVIVDGKAKNRGGIPVCAPIFGPGESVGLNQHGYARDLTWQRYELAEVIDRKNVVLRLTNPRTQDPAIPERFGGCEMTLAISLIENGELGLGEGIAMSLTVRNNSATPFPVHPGFHPYFPVGEGATVANYDVSYDDVMGQKLEADKLNPAGELPIKQSQVAVGGQGKTWLLQSEDLPRFVVWSDNPGKYFCCEPTETGLDVSSQELHGGDSRTYAMELRWLATQGEAR